MHPAVFLDRDGVIIENCDTYVRSWADVHFIPHALTALARLRLSHFRTVIVTNQSVVGRGIITLEAADQINQRLVWRIEEAGGRIDGIYVCPHAPNDNCSCRKPLPGLLLQAASELSLDLSVSYLVGDALTDIQAGQAAGVSQAILVRTGRGHAQASLLETINLKPFLIYRSLQEALDHILPAETS